MSPFPSSHAWKCTSLGLLLLLLHIVEIFLGVLHTRIKILLENLHARPHYQWCKTPGGIWICGCESKALHQGDDRVPWLSAAIWKPLSRISQVLQPSDKGCAVLFFTQTGLNWTPRRVTGCYWRVLKTYTVLNGGVISLTTWYQKRRWEKKILAGLLMKQWEIRCTAMYLLNKSNRKWTVLFLTHLFCHWLRHFRAQPGK